MTLGYHSGANFKRIATNKHRLESEKLKDLDARLSIIEKDIACLRNIVHESMSNQDRDSGPDTSSEIQSENGEEAILHDEAQEATASHEEYELESPVNLPTTPPSSPVQHEKPVTTPPPKHEEPEEAVTEEETV